MASSHLLLPSLIHRHHCSVSDAQFGLGQNRNPAFYQNSERTAGYKTTRGHHPSEVHSYISTHRELLSKHQLIQSWLPSLAGYFSSSFISLLPNNLLSIGRWLASETLAICYASFFHTWCFFVKSVAKQGHNPAPGISSLHQNFQLHYSCVCQWARACWGYWTVQVSSTKRGIV